MTPWGMFVTFLEDTAEVYLLVIKKQANFEGSLAQWQPDPISSP